MLVGVCVDEDANWCALRGCRFVGVRRVETANWVWFAGWTRCVGRSSRGDRGWFLVGTDAGAGVVAG